MCGIIGYLGKNQATPLLLEGLKRLEYRGYDSAGIATVHDHALACRRSKGKLSALEDTITQKPITGTTGIGHTRWATHGAPTEYNAHPHVTQKVAVVHNGIIENFQSLREELEQLGTAFSSETDTEVIPHLITYFLEQGYAPLAAVRQALAKLEGAFALAILFADHDHYLVVAKQGSPLAIGFGEGEMFTGSDAYALAPLTKQICYLEDGDVAELQPSEVHIFDKNGNEVKREIRQTAQSGATIGKGNYRHFMLKEIYEQPVVIGDTLGRYFNAATQEVTLPAMQVDLAAISHITIVACGTSFYAGLTAKYWLEQIARVNVDIDIASEFRYRQAPMREGGLAIFISQSGETADTLAALRFAKTQKQHILSIVNADESSMAHESDILLPTLAGPEIGVASTKAFTTQLVVLACFALALAKARGTISQEEQAAFATALAEVPSRAAQILNHDADIRDLAQILAEAHDILYIGRGTSYAIALEGALKLKELSYIHAEGIAAGELKHGPIALIDETVPVIVIAPSDSLFEKTASNVQEVVARGGHVIFLSDAAGVKRLKSVAAEVIQLPTVHPVVAPILYSIPIQLLAYHVAVAKGTDVDQPRNLAKSVTVE